MKCVNCGHEFESKGDLSFCPACGAKHENTTSAQYYCAWEDQKTGVFDGFVKTWKDSVFSPAEFFKKVPPSGAIGSAMLYGVIVATLSLWIGIAWNAGLSKIPWMMPGGQPEMFEKLFSGSFVWIRFVFAPLGALIGLCIAAGIYHLFLLIVGGAKNGIEASFKAICYAQGPSLFNIIPFCGQIVGLIWIIVLNIIGLREIHKTSTGKAAFSVLFPLILCVGIAIVLVVLAAAFIAKGLWHP